MSFAMQRLFLRKLKSRSLGILVFALLTPAAHAGLLSMQFAGGATEVTLGPSDRVTVDVLFQMNATDKKFNHVTWVEARFDVGPQGVNPDTGGSYVVESESTQLTVETVSTPLPVWDTWATVGVGGPFNSQSFFLSVGTPNDGVLSGNGTEQAPRVIASFVLHKPIQEGALDDLYVAFRALGPLPAVYNGPNAWNNRFGPQTINAGHQFEIGRGNPGDHRPNDYYHGYEAFQPLIIHQVPESNGLALVTLVAMAALRRRPEPSPFQIGPQAGVRDSRSARRRATSYFPMTRAGERNTCRTDHLIPWWISTFAMSTGAQVNCRLVRPRLWRTGFRPSR